MFFCVRNLQVISRTFCLYSRPDFIMTWRKALLDSFTQYVKINIPSVFDVPPEKQNRVEEQIGQQPFQKEE